MTRNNQPKSLNFVTLGGDLELHNLYPTQSDIVLSEEDGKIRLNQIWWISRIQRHRQGVRLFVLGVDGFLSIDKHEWGILKKYFPVCGRCQHVSTFENPIQDNGYHLYTCEDYFGSISLTASD